jgi:hypothetical protein
VFPSPHHFLSAVGVIAPRASLPPSTRRLKRDKGYTVSGWPV